MRLLHLLTSHDAPGTGVPRFSQYFRQAFPQVVNIVPAELPSIRWGDDVVVTDNHLSVRVPSRVKTIVVHHGCAPYHYEVDPKWRSASTEKIATEQRLMFHLPNRVYVAPSLWVADVFKRYAPQGYQSLMLVLPHWVPLIPPEKRDNADRFMRTTSLWRPRIIGDWRNHNKGKDVIEKIQEAMPDCDFFALDFDKDEPRVKWYQGADAYLCLSLSEGAPYSVADAEAAGLPIATTVVGNVHEFEGCWRIENRNNVNEVCDAVRSALEGASTRGSSFFEKHNFEAWQAAWKVVIEEVVSR